MPVTAHSTQLARRQPCGLHSGAQEAGRPAGAGAYAAGGSGHLVSEDGHCLSLAGSLPEAVVTSPRGQQQCLQWDAAVTGAGGGAAGGGCPPASQ